MSVNPSITFGVECGASGFGRDLLLKAQGVRVERVTGRLDKTVTTFGDTSDGACILCLNEEGAVLCRSETASRWYLLPQNGVGLFLSGRRTLLRIAKGVHTAYLVTLPIDQLGGLCTTVTGTSLGIQNGSGMPFRTTIPYFEPAMERFGKALASNSLAYALPMLMSVVAEAFAFIYSGDNNALLAPTPLGLQESIQRLVDAVREDPGRPWPLKEAADEVGYSPFHFSRIFKQLVGYGFHEFVDRTRTQHAVELLCATDEPVDLVATNSGFGTTQGLRESIREYIGLVPTELRSDPDDELIS